MSSGRVTSYWIFSVVAAAFLIGGCDKAADRQSAAKQTLLSADPANLLQNAYVGRAVLDKAKFSALMMKYQSQSTFTERDNVDMIIQLAVVKTAPDWLTAQTAAEVDRIYPGLRKRKAQLESLNIRFAMNFDEHSRSDTSYFVAQAEAPMALLIGDAVILATALHAIMDNNPNLRAQMSSLITPTAINQIESTPSASSDIGASAPPTTGNGRCTEDEEKRINEWYHKICDGIEKCRRSNSRSKNESIRDQYIDCLNARNHAANVCFNGEYDERHINVMSNINKQKLTPCYRMIEEAGEEGTLNKIIEEITSVFTK